MRQHHVRQLRNIFKYVVTVPVDAITDPAPTLRRWADAALRWKFEQRAVYIYFDNDQKAAAPKDAGRLAGIVNAAFKKCR